MYICICGNRCVNWMGGILSQCIQISSHHGVHFKCFTILYVNYTSRNLKNKLLGINATRTNLEIHQSLIPLK